MSNPNEFQIAELRKELRFEAAHFLPMTPPGHKCGRLHGHSFRLTIVISGPIDPSSGWVMDFADIKAACAPIIDQLDHHHLNEIEGLENPTAEVLADWVWKRLKPELPLLKEICVQETCTASCVYRGPSQQ